MRIKGDVSDKFDVLVDKHVKADVELATEVLKNNLYGSDDDQEV